MLIPCYVAVIGLSAFWVWIAVQDVPDHLPPEPPFISFARSLILSFFLLFFAAQAAFRTARLFWKLEYERRTHNDSP